MSPTMEPLFRAMSKTQDNLDQVKYLFYRAITLLMAYTAPVYVLLWWTAEPFITFVYGAKWSDAGAPMSILTLVGFFLNFALPSSVLLAVRNRLTGEMVATAINIPIMAAACIVGLQWGLEGVAWGIVLAQVIHAVQLYVLVLKALPTRAVDLLRAAAPGLTLAGMTFAFLVLVDVALGEHRSTQPLIYLLGMWTLGGAFAVTAFLALPLPTLKGEAARWRTLVSSRLKSILQRGGH
jgi:O-antigen/teichoic acid export membrane protein